MSQRASGHDCEPLPVELGVNTPLRAQSLWSLTAAEPESPASHNRNSGKSCASTEPLPSHCSGLLEQPERGTPWAHACLFVSRIPFTARGPVPLGFCQITSSDRYERCALTETSSWETELFKGCLNPHTRQRCVGWECVCVEGDRTGTPLPDESGHLAPLPLPLRVQPGRLRAPLAEYQTLPSD